MTRKRDWRTHKARRPGAITGAEWQVLVREVCERQGWRCGDCGAIGHAMQGHHIVARSAPGGADVIGNVIGLDSDCHERVTRAGWRKYVARFRAYVEERDAQSPAQSGGQRGRG